MLLHLPVVERIFYEHKKTCTVWWRNPVTWTSWWTTISLSCLLILCTRIFPLFCKSFYACHICTKHIMAEGLSLNSSEWHLWITHLFIHKIFIESLFCSRSFSKYWAMVGNKIDEVLVTELFSVCMRMRIASKHDNSR